MSSVPESLPPSWSLVTLSNLIAPDGVFVDGDWVESKDQDPDGDVRLIQLADVGDGEFRDRSARFLTAAKSSELGCTFLERGDLLVARMPDPLGRCCIFPLQGQSKFVTVVDVCIVRPGWTGIEPKFLMYAINSLGVRSAIAGLQSGSTRKRISRGNLATVQVPIAPLPEQRRIVAKIEELFSELDASAESLTRARAQLKTYRQALLKAAFEGKLTADWRAANPMKEGRNSTLSRIQAERVRRYEGELQEWRRAIDHWNRGEKESEKPRRPSVPEQLLISEPVEDGRHPNEWDSIPLGNLNVDVFDGPFGSNLKTSDYEPTGVRVIRLENIGYGRFINEKRSFVSKEKYETIKTHTVRPGNIVVSSFVTDGIRSAIIPEAVSFAVNKADCFVIKLFGNRMLGRFLNYFLESRDAYRQLKDLIHGVGRPRINTTQLKNLFIPVPEPGEQQLIVGKIEAVLSECDEADASVEAELRRVTALRQSILKRAFSGQLVPQDASDEPAAVLLARLRESSEAAPRKTRRKLFA